MSVSYVAKEWLGKTPRWVRENLMSRDVAEMRAFLHVTGVEQAWAYADRKSKEQYLRVATKKIDEEDPDFKYLSVPEQVDAVVRRAKEIAVNQANEGNEFVAMDTEGNVLDEEGNIDPDRQSAVRQPTFGGSETQERGRGLGLERPKTFGRKAADLG